MGGLDLRSEIAQQLKKDYMHRDADDAHCAMCGASDKPLACHVIEKSVSEKNTLPDGFVPLSHSRGFYRGSFPLCLKCAPACKKCSLPILRKNTMLFAKKLDATIGNGFCHDHIHAENIIDSIALRLNRLSLKSRLFISFLLGTIWVGFLAVIFSNIDDRYIFLLLILMACCFAILSITTRMLNEEHQGFKRLTFVLAMIGSSVSLFFVNVSRFWGISILVFFVTGAVMTYGKSIGLWVYDGFRKQQ